MKERRPERKAQPNILQAMEIFKDPKTAEVMYYVWRHLAISDSEILEKSRRNKNTEEPLTNDILQEKLSILVENGFVIKKDAEPGGSDLYFQSSRGVRILRALRKI